MRKNIKYLLLVLVLIAVVAVPMSRVHAAATFTVDSTADDSDSSAGDGSCDIGDGSCTLRAALQEANALAGADVIEFDLPGPGYTISPTSLLPVITEAVTIDGTTQTGWVVNGADAPEAFDGTMVVVVDGTSAGNVSGFNVQADSVAIKGLVISNFTYAGISLANGASNVEITGNYIGTEDDGTTSAGNGSNGIGIFDSTDVTIGGTSPTDRNVIANNGDNGIYAQDVTTDTITIQGNYIGLGADGSALGNTAHGVDLISGPTSVTIGGTASGAKNAISNNGGDGVYLDGVDDNSVIGNYIGTDNTGLIDMGNTGSGISMSQGSSGNTVGGTISGSRNIISGNDGTAGISIVDDTSDSNVIKGNYIGVGSDGVTEIANTGQGISIYGGDGGSIGGTTLLARNVVSGNNSNGISLANGSDDWSVKGNYIGVSADGATPVPNSNGSASGLIISSSNDNQIGGTTLMSRNIISASASSSGLVIMGASTGNAVQGNYIGTNPDGEVEAGFGNGGAGVVLLGYSGVPSDNIIGGSVSGAGNVIAGNIAGVFVFARSATDPINNTIIGNSIHDNTGGFLSSLGIDLLDDTNGDFTPDDQVGVTANDGGDADAGPNDYLNYPVLNSTSANAGTLEVDFDLDVDGSAPNGYRVEFFANSTDDASGNGEGEIYLGYKNVAGDVTDDIATIAIPSTFTTGNYSITATTTERDDSADGFGATSEFAENLLNRTITAANFTETVDVPAGWGVPPTDLLALIRAGGDATAAPDTQTTVALRNAPSTSFNPGLDALALSEETDVSVHETGAFPISSSEVCPADTPVTITVGGSTSTIVAMTGLEPSTSSNNSVRAVFDLTDSSTPYLSVSDNSSTGDVFNHPSASFETTFGRLDSLYVVTNVQIIEGLLASPPNGSQASTTETIPTIGLTYDDSDCGAMASTTSSTSSDDSLADTGQNTNVYKAVAIVAIIAPLAYLRKKLFV